MKYKYDTCFCNHCEKDNKIKILYEHVISREISFEYGILNDVFRLVQCEECHSIFIMRILDDTDTSYSNRYIQTIPEKNIVIDNFKHKYLYKHSVLNNDYKDPYYVFCMYREILNAINTKSFWIAFCEMRSVIEKICCDKLECKAGKFSDMHNKIKNSQLITDATKDIIIRILDAAHSSVHNAYFPNQEQITQCLSALEEFLNQIYILPQKSVDISELRLPKRNGRI